MCMYKNIINNIVVACACAKHIINNTVLAYVCINNTIYNSFVVITLGCFGISSFEKVKTKK